MSKRKRSGLDLKTKINIINEVEKQNSNKTLIAKQFNIPKSTLSTILRNKDKICAAIATGNVGMKSKRFRGADYNDLESELLKWFNHIRSQNIPLSGPFIMEKANKIASTLSLLLFIQEKNC